MSVHSLGLYDDAYTVSFDVKNSGGVDGHEVSQVYLVSCLSGLCHRLGLILSCIHRASPSPLASLPSCSGVRVAFFDSVLAS